MKIYKPNQPFIFIHIPKTAGTSVADIFNTWYGNRLLLHYYDEVAETMPIKHDYKLTYNEPFPTCIYGHFNRKRGFGLEDYYPDINQLVTIIRDPFERAVSGYFFSENHSKRWRQKNKFFKKSINDFLKNRQSGILNFFPKELNKNNFKEIIEEKFIYIGLTEYLEESLIKLSEKINQPYSPRAIQHLNATDRNKNILNESREIYIENNKMEYKIYNYILNKRIS